MTSAQRLRLVLALGVVNLVLATVALGVGFSGLPLANPPGATTPGFAEVSPGSTATPQATTGQPTDRVEPTAVPTAPTAEPTTPTTTNPPSTPPSGAPEPSPTPTGSAVPLATPPAGSPEPTTPPPVAVVSHSTPPPLVAGGQGPGATPVPVPSPTPQPTKATTEGPGTCDSPHSGTPDCPRAHGHGQKAHGHGPRGHGPKAKAHGHTRTASHNGGHGEVATNDTPRRSSRSARRLANGRRLRSDHPGR